MANLLQKMSRWFASSGFVFWRRGGAAGVDDTAGVKNQDQRHSLGLRGERLAVDFLKQLGYRILEHGHRKKLGEIDVVAVDGECVVFVEVKTWRREGDVDPSAAVTLAKQDKITRTALTYLKAHGLLNQPARFDVIAIVLDDKPRSEPKIRHYQHAFEASGAGQLFR